MTKGKLRAEKVRHYCYIGMLYEQRREVLNWGKISGYVILKTQTQQPSRCTWILHSWCLSWCLSWRCFLGAESWWWCLLIKASSKKYELTRYVSCKRAWKWYHKFGKYTYWTWHAEAAVIWPVFMSTTSWLSWFACCLERWDDACNLKQCVYVR